MNLDRLKLKRPLPPDELQRLSKACPARMEPAPDLANWIACHFIEPDGVLYRPRHKHLKRARLGVLWTNVALKMQGKDVDATAEIPSVQGNAWKKASYEQQLLDWFGFRPDFLLTFYAPRAVLRSDAAFCALVRHELCHCAQKRDRENQPKFDEDGRPVFAMIGHDIEEFVDVVEDFGVENCAGRAVEFVEAAKKKPLVAASNIRIACGACLR